MTRYGTPRVLEDCLEPRLAAVMQRELELRQILHKALTSSDLFWSPVMQSNAVS